MAKKWSKLKRREYQKKYRHDRGINKKYYGLKYPEMYEVEEEEDED